MSRPKKKYGHHSNHDHDGTEGKDHIHGHKGDDTITGLGGNDRIKGGKGDDSLDGGAGNDRLSGGKGEDTLLGGEGCDRLKGGKGEDTLDGGAGNDRVSGGKGNDLIIHSIAENVGAYDHYHGGRGSDTLRLVVNAADNDAAMQAQIQVVKDWIESGGRGHKSFVLGTSVLTLHSIENFELVVEGDDDVIVIEDSNTGSPVDVDTTSDPATADNDREITVTGTDDVNATTGGGDDVVTTSSGDDVIDAGDGDNVVNAGDGDNTVTTAGGADTITAGTGNDTIDAGGGDDTVLAGDGDDVVDAGEGDDVIIGGSGAGNDFFDGGTGSDTVTYPSVSAASNMIIDLREISRDGQTLDSGSGGATLAVGSFLTNIGRNAGDQVGYAYDTNDEMSYDILVNIENAVGGAGDDLIFGNFYNNQLFGGGGDDVIYGIGGENHIEGGAGNDTFILSYSSNVMAGGTGSDTFTMIDSIFENRILDFEIGTDTLDLSRTMATDRAFVEGLGVTQEDKNADGNDDLVIRFTSWSQGQFLVLDNLTMTDWNAMNVNGQINYSQPGIAYYGTSGDDSAALATLGSGGDTIFAREGDETIRVFGSDSVLQGSGNDTIDFSDATGYTSLQYDQRFDSTGPAVFDGGITVNIAVTDFGETQNNSMDGTVVKGGAGQYGTDTLVDVDIATGPTNDGFALRGTEFSDSFDVEISQDAWIAIYSGRGSDSITFHGNGGGRLSYENENVAIHYGDGLGGRAVYNGSSVSGQVEVFDLGGTQLETDSLTFSAYLELVGGNGNDVFLGADGMSERFIGGRGNDVFDGGTGGQDRARFDRGGITSIEVDLMDANAETINYDGGAGAGGDSYSSTLIDIEFIRASNGNDSISMSNVDEKVQGRSGNDFIDGRGGADELEGQNGDDTVLGGAGDDTISGGSGNDVILGGTENDFIEGDSGNDDLWGGDGVDLILGGIGDDTISGGLGDDTVEGGDGADVFLFSPGDGRDTINDFSFADGDRIDLTSHGFTVITDFLVTFDGTNTVIDLLNGTDTITVLGVDLTALAVPNDTFIYDGGAINVINGTTGDDVLNGTAGADWIIGLDGVDQLFGGAGDDLLDAGDNTDYDLISPGTGNDTIFYTNSLNGYQGLSYADYVASNGITANLDGINNTGTVDKGADGFDTIIDVANPLNAGWVAGGFGFVATALNDTININNLSSGQWMQLTTGAGDDTIDITSGPVRLDYRNSANGIDVDLASGKAWDDGWGDEDTFSGTGSIWEVRGSNFSDTIVGSNENESFIGEQGNDTIDGGGGFDRMRFDRGGVNDVTIDLAVGTATGTWGGAAFTYTVSNIEFIRGSNSGTDSISGSTEDERLEGRNGDDFINGRGGADEINGGNGLDNLTGGAGADNLTGGADADTFIFAAGDGVDHITDFDYDAGDRVDLTAYTFASTGGFTNINFDGFHTFVDLNGTDHVTFDNFDLLSLGANKEDAFIF